MESECRGDSTLPSVTTRLILQHSELPPEQINPSVA